MTDIKIVSDDEKGVRLELFLRREDLFTMSKLGEDVLVKIQPGNPTSDGLRALLNYYILTEKMWSS